MNYNLEYEFELECRSETESGPKSEFETKIESEC